ncbi:MULTISPECIES: DUF305 domain-containing protein [Prauserella]|uniref:DUF305 domain-containing protein n=2 Tax=Prauserella TaxID=142577 RepID=A0A318LF98_9PSEU|nr:MULTISPECIES: DUF305 domain-containing protein [Prauserella]PXY17548.1 DUF305 domain-containing protein [Prauserella flavalba]PXY18597.1 DUF305 domain-containing protein [Prauserella coralliicola]TKG63529.1 DUF305 domain-containing protein [Prauserella endophytica]
MKKTLIGAGAAALLALAAGCGGNDDDMSGMDMGQSGSSAPATSATQAGHNDDDVAFAQMMIPHHQQAVDMAKMAVERATDPKVKNLASRIQGAQDPEIQQMTNMLKTWGAPATPTMSSMPGMDMPGMEGMEGGMSDQEMRQLEQASGADFDRLWMEMMIKHHQGAVDMAKDELKNGSNAEAKALAQQIINAQEAEITEMQAMLDQQ